MKEITKAEALKQGYTLCGNDKGEYQHLSPIEDLNEIDLDGTWYLAEKESYYTPTIDADTISDMLADHMESNNGNETQDDTEEVWRIVKALDFEATAEMINEALKSKEYFKITDIKIVG